MHLSIRTAAHAALCCTTIALTAGTAGAQEEAPAPIYSPPPPPPPPPPAAPPTEGTPDESGGAHVGLFINPLAMAFGEFGAEVDVKLARFVSINVVGAYMSEGNATAFGGSLGAQFFLSDSAFRGWYLYPQVPLAVASASVSGASATALGYGIGATAGYQWNWDFGLALRLGLGGGYRTITATGQSGSTTAYESLSGGTLLGDAALGWTF